MIRKFCLYGFLKNLRFFEPFLYLFFLSRGVSFLHIGILIAVRELSQMIAEIPTGVLADLFGRRRTMLLCFATFILSFALFYWGLDYWVFVLAFMLFGLGEALRTGTHKAIILDHLDENDLSHLKTRYYGLTRAWSLLGSGLSALLAGALVFFSDSYDYIFIASIIPYFLALLLIFSYPRDPEGKIYGDRAQPFKKEVVHHIKAIAHSFRHTAHLARSVGSSAYFDATFKVTRDYLQPILQVYIVLAGGIIALYFTVSETQDLAIITGISYFLIFLVTAISSRSAHKFEKLLVGSAVSLDLIYLTFALLILMVGLFIEMGLLVPVLLVFILIYIIINIRRPIMVGYIGGIMEKDQRATVLSIESQLKSVFAMVLAPVLGLFADHFGIQAVFFASSAILLLLIPFFLLVKKNK